MRSRLKLVFPIIVTVMLLFSASACAPTPIHNTVAEAVAGSPGDFINFEVVRIDPFYGGVAYSASADQYAFAVYDIARDDIMVVVKSKDIGFKPKDRDFVRISEGKLVESLPDSPWPVYVIAGKVELTSAPEDWRE